MILFSRDIHIFQASFEKKDSLIEDDLFLLSGDEKERAKRYYFERDRLRFIFRRSILRKLLSRYTGQEASAIRFQYGKYGKPYLGDTKKGNTCAFNCSHSRDLVLLAFSSSVPLGVDCECMMRELDFTGITKRFFSQSEISAILSLPGPSQKEAFFNCWTRKEAFIKAQGKGLSFGLDQFDVSLRPGESAKLLRTRYDEKDAREWSLYDLKTFPGFKAALAAKSKRLKLTYFDWIS